MRQLKENIDIALNSALAGFDIPERLKDAMNYSLLAGGKRLRPCLCLLCAGMIDPDNRAARQKAIMPFACALEMIHTYSLIHDDLPAMDDDDLRRGRPSNHKAFDEATAILAGDALLTDAFDLMSRPMFNGIPAERVVRAISIVAQAAGSRGMVGGQMLDIACTGLGTTAKPGDLALLRRLQEMQSGKTGALFRASCVSGGVLAGATKEEYAALDAYAAAFGLAFQIVDDILDITQDTATIGKPAGSDTEQGKLTWPSLIGLDAARARAAEEASKAITALAIFHGPDADTLRSLTTSMLTRIN